MPMASRSLARRYATSLLMTYYGRATRRMTSFCRRTIRAGKAIRADYTCVRSPSDVGRSRVMARGGVPEPPRHGTLRQRGSRDVAAPQRVDAYQHGCSSSRTQLRP